MVKHLPISSRVIGVPAAEMARILTHRTVVAGSNHTVTHLDQATALYARDALAKALYVVYARVHFDMPVAMTLRHCVSIVN